MPTSSPPVGDEVAPASAARQSAELAKNAFISPRSFGCGCAALKSVWTTGLASSARDFELAGKLPRKLRGNHALCACGWLGGEIYQSARLGLRSAKVGQ